MFDKLFKRPYYVRRHMRAPLLEERIKYLECTISSGMVFTTITSTAQYLLRVVEFLQLKDDNKVITLEEIETAADKWARYKSNNPAKNGVFSMSSKITFSKFAKMRFIHDTSQWLDMVGCLENTSKSSIPFEVYLDQYIDYMRHEQGLSENTIRTRISALTDFF